MSFYFREKPRFGDKLRGKPRDELLQDWKQQLDDDSKSFFEPTSARLTRDPFDRRTAFSRGFPFDDVEGFGRRGTDIRSHLDDLASRHPEFADHLLGPPWGEIPSFNTGSLRNRRRDSGGSSSHQGHPDEDARSQASGSSGKSGKSAASGASGVSSLHGESSIPGERQSSTIDRRFDDNSESTSNPRGNPIPHYGLRNTVDIGQHRHDMENSERNDRGQRSMSAPPENRQQDDVPTYVEGDDGRQSRQLPNQRYVSRVDITPQFVQPPSQRQSPNVQGTKSNKSQQRATTGNVRHIPIFVEGRDEPVLPKNIDEVDRETASSWSHDKSQSRVPPQFQQSQQQPQPQPQFHRPSHFNQHYTGRPREWFPSFDEEFYSPQSSFQQSVPHRRPQREEIFTSRSDSPTQSDQYRRYHGDDRRQQQEQPQPQPRPQPQPQQPQQTQEIPSEPRKQTRPKDPLEKVAEVQKEVDALTEQVKSWNGTSRKDKRYMYIDEMLTRELIKLDDIETEGKENVRQARKNAIKSIQDSISLLESKAPLPEQLGEPVLPMESPVVTSDLGNSEMSETAMDREENIANEQQSSSSSSPPPPVENNDIEKSEKQNRENAIEREDDNEIGRVDGSRDSTVENGSVEKLEPVRPMDVPQPVFETSTEPIDPSTKITGSEETENPMKSPKVVKKIKKTRKQSSQKQEPISDDAIALPAPENHRIDGVE